jgi:hypothetical protein
MRLIGQPKTEDDVLHAPVITELKHGETAFAVTQVSMLDAIVLTYDCDIDDALYGIRNQDDDGNPLVTVAAARELDVYHKTRLNIIAKGGMPGLAYFPSGTKWPDRIIDFSTMQTIDMRVLLPRIPYRLVGLTNRGQLRLVEAMGHAIGDVYRRRRGPGDAGNPSLLADAYRAFSGNDFPGPE